jgi:2,6-dihydroxypseudooxynicotine hydrolase
MSRETIDSLYETYTHRFLAEGVPYRDLMDMKATIADLAQWPAVWSESAAAAEARADAAMARHCALTAGTELARASLFSFFAQFLLWHDPATKRTAYEHCARAFRRAAPLLDPPLEPVTIPFAGIALPGYLRKPKGVSRPPCVVLVGGLDTTKEEQLVISTLCVQRGLATLAYDGPGQGETFDRMKLSADFEKSICAVLDALAGRSDIDAARIGLIGRSLGGHYVPKAAALDRRVKAAVAWGAMYHLKNWSTMPTLTQQGFAYVTGSKSVEDARPFFEAVNLEGLAAKITCPLQIVHGGLDPITPTENATRMKAEASGPTELLFWTDSLHCAHDRAHIVRPAMADFMWRYLSRS